MPRWNSGVRGPRISTPLNNPFTMRKSRSVPALPPISPANVGLLKPLLTHKRGWITQIAWSPNGSQLAVSHVEGIHVYTVRLNESNKPEIGAWYPYIGHTEPVRAVDFNRDGTRLASAGDDGTVRIWSTATRETEQVFEPGVGPIHTVAFSPDGRYVGFAGGDHAVRVYGVGTNPERVTLIGHTEGIEAVVFYPLGHVVASGGWDLTVRLWLWELEHRDRMKLFTRHEARVDTIAFSPDGTKMASASRTGDVQLWNLVDNERVGVYQVPDQKAVDEVVFSPDGKLLVAATRDMTLGWWDLSSDRPFADGPFVKLEGHRKPIISLAFHPQGTLLATAGGDHSLKIWGIRE